MWFKVSPTVCNTCKVSFKFYVMVLQKASICLWFFRKCTQFGSWNVWHICGQNPYKYWNPLVARNLERNVCLCINFVIMVCIVEDLECSWDFFISSWNTSKEPSPIISPFVRLDISFLHRFSKRILYGLGFKLRYLCCGNRLMTELKYP